MTNLLQTLTLWTPMVFHPVKDAATHELLRGVLPEPDPVVRERALESLGLIRQPEDLALVRKFLEAPFEATRQRAARTAEALGAPLGSRDAAAAAATRRGAGVGAGAGASGAKVAATIAEGLRSENPAIVADTLRRMDAGVVPANAAAVLAKLEDAEIVVQEEAVRAVGRGALAQAVPQLLKKLGDADEGLRRVSAEALAILGAKGERGAVIAGVVARLETDESSLVRVAAGNVLVALHDEAALAALRKLFTHARGVTRQAAAQTLGAWGDAALAGELEPLLEDAEDLVARTAAEALGQLKNSQAKAPLLAQLPLRKPFVQEKIAWALGELRATEAIGALAKLAATDQENLKVEVVRALGKTGDKAALPFLRQVLFSISVTNLMPRPRVAALESLQDARDKAAIPRALELVTKRVVPPPPGGGPSHDENSVRVAALRFLAALGDKTTGAALQAAFTEIAPRDIRAAVAETYSALTGRVYLPVPDEDSRPHFVESIAVPTRPPVPVPGVKLKE